MSTSSTSKILSIPNTRIWGGSQKLNRIEEARRRLEFYEQFIEGGGTKGFRFDADVANSILQAARWFGDYNHVDKQLKCLDLVARYYMSSNLLNANTLEILNEIRTICGQNPRYHHCLPKLDLMISQFIYLAQVACEDNLPNFTTNPPIDV